MNFFKKNVADSEEYLIRLDALEVALAFTSVARTNRPNYSDRDFLMATDHIADYLRAGKVPEILGEATKAALRGKN